MVALLSNSGRTIQCLTLFLDRVSYIAIKYSDFAKYRFFQIDTKWIVCYTICMKNEIWKPIEKIVDKKGQVFIPVGYEVSDLGRVRSYNKRFGRGPSSGIGFRGLAKEPTIITGRPDPRGYYQVTLTDSVTKKRKNFRIHTLVMQAFVGLADEDEMVCHYNDIKTDNRLENLRYDTSKANQQDRIRNSKNFSDSVI